jgi:hypothetical protein
MGAAASGSEGSEGNLGCGGTAGLSDGGTPTKLIAGLEIGLRSGSSSVTPSGALSEVASMTLVLLMDLSSKSSATKLPMR